MTSVRSQEKVEVAESSGTPSNSWYTTDAYPDFNVAANIRRSMAEQQQIKVEVDLNAAIARAEESERKRKFDFEDRAIREIAVCLDAQVPWVGAAGIILKNIWLYRHVDMKNYLKVVIEDLDGELHAYEGLLEDFHGCRDGNDIMIRALGG